MPSLKDIVDKYHDKTEIETIINTLNTTIAQQSTLITELTSRLDTMESYRHVIEVGSLDNADKQWYRKWSDGWIEQGGIFSNATADWTFRATTLAIPFTDINYSICIHGPLYTSYTYVGSISAKTLTSFTLQHYKVAAWTFYPTYYCCGF